MPPHGRLIGVAVLAVGYALLAHHTNISQGHYLGPLLALGPLLLAAVAWMRGICRPWLAACLLASACILLALRWPQLSSHYSTLYWIEHAGTELALCLLFSRSLQPGREPLCTGFARLAHGELTPDIEAYTRKLTRAWSLLFATLATASTVLYFSAPLSWWSVFANFVTGPLIGLMFVVEYAVRLRRLPKVRHVPLVESVKAFWKAGI